MSAQATPTATPRPRARLRPLLRVAAFACVTAAVVACGDSGTGPSKNDSVGLYTLATYNDSALPYTRTSEDTSYEYIYSAKVTLLSGSIELRADKTFEEKLALHVLFSSTDPNEQPQDTTLTDGAGGNYSINGSSLIMTSLPYHAFDGSLVVDTTKAQIVGNTITIADTSSAGVTKVVFKK